MMTVTALSAFGASWPQHKLRPQCRARPTSFLFALGYRADYQKLFDVMVLEHRNPRVVEAAYLGKPERTRGRSKRQYSVSRNGALDGAERAKPSNGRVRHAISPSDICQRVTAI
jgi:hypothetical protein